MVNRSFLCGFSLSIALNEGEKSTNSFEAIRIYCEAILEIYKK